MSSCLLRVRELALAVALVIKNPLASEEDVRDMDLIPGSRRSPGEWHGNPLQYSFLENPMDRWAWWATVCRVAKSQPWLKRLSTVQGVGLWHVARKAHFFSAQPARDPQWLYLHLGGWPQCGFKLPASSGSSRSLQHPVLSAQGAKSFWVVFHTLDGIIGNHKG